MSYIFKEDANSVVLGNSNAQEVTPLNRKGATSNVYIVRIDGKEHFMKQLRPQLKDDWRYRSVYRKEFEVGHSINSEYIVKYEAIGENAEGTYILMEHVNGLTLDEKIASAPEYFTKEENFEKLFVQLLHGLKALHAANVAHLDLKPENVMLTQVNNNVKIVDLGFCFADAYSHTSGTNKHFAAPELRDGDNKEVDARTDIYALGQLMRYVKEMACVDVSQRMERIIERCTQPSKQERYENVDEVLKAMAKKRRWVRWTLIAIALALLAVIGTELHKFSLTADYAIQKQRLQWFLSPLEYDFEHENTHYRILSEDSLTCMAVGGKRVDAIYIHDKVPYKGKEYTPVAIADRAFAWRDAGSVYIPMGVKEIGNYAFAHCRRIQSLNFPESVEKLGEHCCESMHTLMSLRLSSNIKEIPKNAFVECTWLKKLLIPEGVERLGLDAFSLCTRLEEVSLPSTLKAIDRGVFWRCRNLRSFTIPASVETMGEYILFECDSLKDVYCPHVVPMQIPPLYYKTNATLHVPRGSEELYSKEEYWAKAGKIVGDL